MNRIINFIKSPRYVLPTIAFLVVAVLSIPFALVRAMVVVLLGLGLIWLTGCTVVFIFYYLQFCIKTNTWVNPISYFRGMY